MLSQEIRNKIFISIPTSFIVDGKVYQAYKEYAHLANVSEHLKKFPNDIYIVIDYGDDEIYKKETPINYLWGQKVNEDGDIEYQKGTRNNCGLNIHVYSTWVPKYKNVPFDMAEVLNTLQFWQLFTLEKYVDYIQVKSIQPIEETDDRILHLVLPCTFTYTNTMIEVVSPIETIEYTVNNK